MMNEKIKSKSKELIPFLSETRKYLHMHPELSFDEYKTSEFIQNILRKNEIEFESGIVGTGIVATVKGNKPGKIRAIRAELDALPILEKNDTGYKSVKAGLMHACGHDVHMTCLVGAAIILKELKSDLEGTVHFIFQPGEEKLPGGASLMIKDGLLEKYKPEYIIAQHVYPNLKAGQIGICPGQYMASSDEIYIEVKGKGGHGALPHLAVDTVLAASQIIIALQTVVSRNANPFIPSVLTFGKINTEGGATNVIPEKVSIEGTFRTMDEQWRKAAKLKIKQLAIDIATSFGTEAVINIIDGYPMLFNDLEQTAIVKSKAIDYLGMDNVIDISQRMTSEDFAYFAGKLPCVFYRLGTNNENNDYCHSVHSPHFDVDQRSLETGSGLIAALVT